MKLNIPQKYIEFVKYIYTKKHILTNAYKDYSVAEKINDHYEDAKEFRASDDLLYYLVYNSICIEYPIKLANSNYYFHFFDEIFGDEEIKNLILKSECKSEFYTIIKDIIPFYNELDRLIKNKQKYMVLKKYKEILHILNMETLNLYPEDKFAEECKKRYGADYNRVLDNKLRLKNNRYKKEKEFNIETLPYMKNSSITCHFLIDYFHKKMLNYFHQTNYIYKPIDNEYGFYKLNKINIITYRHDDTIRLHVNHLNINYSMKQANFWGIINTKGIKYKYIIPKSFKRLADKYKPCIIVPEDYMDEAFVSYLTKEVGYDINNIFLQEELIKIGFDLESFEDRKGILDAEGIVYYKDPHLVDILKIKDISNYETLEKILLKPIKKRNEYYNKLSSHYKGVMRQIKEKRMPSQNHGNSKFKK